MKKFVALAAAALVLMVVSDLTIAGQAMAANTRGPLGYQLMCLKTPAECKGGGAHQVEASPQVLRVMKQVNASVNRHIRPRHDKGADVWTVGASTGDCEDYALTKRHQLIKAGIPASALRIAYVKTRSGEGHAVLVVNTGRVKYVLDNLNAAIRPLSQTGYRLISMQSADPKSWS